MIRIVASLLFAVSATLAHADSAPFDPTIDECAAPDAQCLPNPVEPRKLTASTA